MTGTRLASSAKRALRRGVPIMGYVGPNGGSKSATMVWDSMPSLDAGRVCLSTVRLVDWRDPRPCAGWRFDHDTRQLVDCELCALQLQPIPDFDPEPIVLPDGTVIPAMVPDLRGGAHLQAHPFYQPVTGWQQVLDAVKCDLLFDEVTGGASARDSQTMPSAVANTLVQMRRADVVVRWSSPSWRRADTILRECSQGVTHCVGFFAKRAAGDEADRVWQQRRLFRRRTYDAADFDEFTEGKRQQMKPLGTDWAWGPGSDMFAAYDTYAAVSTIGTVSEGGTCLRCSGSRRRPVCSCPKDTEPDQDAGGAPA